MLEVVNFSLILITVNNLILLWLEANNWTFFPPSYNPNCNEISKPNMESKFIIEWNFNIKLNKNIYKINNKRLRTNSSKSLRADILLYKFLIFYFRDHLLLCYYTIEIYLKIIKSVVIVINCNIQTIRYRRYPFFLYFNFNFNAQFPFLIWWLFFIDNFLKLNVNFESPMSTN